MSQLSQLEAKAPDDSLDYRIDYDDWLEGDDIIVLSEWEVPDALTVEQEESDATSATIWVSGGTPGSYRLVNTITTASIPPRIKSRAITITVKDL